MNSRIKKLIPFFLSALMLLAAISLACNLPANLQERFLGSKGTITPTPAPTNTPQPLPPTIVESEPAAGSTISHLKPITIHFNQSMDQDSVEGALSLEPSIPGAFTWKDSSTLTYSPTDPLQPNSTLVFRLDTTARASNGLSLLEPVHFKFYAPDNLKAAHFLPVPGGVEIDPASAVVVTFNQPVVPLGESLMDAPAGFSLTPSVPGTGEWINTSTYMFTPDPGLSGGVTYQAELSPNLISTFGAGLEPSSPTTWGFSTAYPELLDFAPYDGADDIELDASLDLVFNQAVDPESIASNLKLVNSSGDQISGKLEWSEDLTEFNFIPDRLLDRAMTYAAVLPGEVISAGGTPLQLDTSWGFRTVGEFTFLGTPGGQTYTTSIYDGVTLYFNSPVDRDTVEESISIFPDVPNLSQGSGSPGTVLQLYGDFDPLTTYSLLMKETLADEWGSTLSYPISIQFTTEPLRSNLTITQGNNILFLTGSENAIPAIGTNLYQVNVNAGSIPVEDYAMFFGATRYSSLDDYYPADVQYWNHIINVPGDKTYTMNLPLNLAGTSLAPGLYRYQIYSQELPYNPSPYLLAVSNVHMTMKTSPHDMMIWAVDLETGEPVKDADITVYIEYGKVFTRGRTNQDGIFQGEFEYPFDLYDNIFYAVMGTPGQDDFGITASTWGFGTEPYSFNLRSDYGIPQPRTYIYTDRPIYRPGQTVYYRLVHRLPEDGDYILPTEKEISVTIDIPQGEDKKVLLPLSEYGTAHGEYKLSSYAQPGYYQIETKHGMVLFQVAEYRKPEIELNVSLDSEESLIADSWKGSVDARYYFDAPASEILLNWSLRATGTSFYLPGYQVGVMDTNWYPFFDSSIWGTAIDSGESETDAQGKRSIKGTLSNLDKYEKEVRLPAIYTLKVTAEDESGFQVTDQAEILVHPSEFYIGVKPSSWVGKVDQETPVDIKVVDWEKEADGVHNLRAVFNKVTWRSEIGDFGMIENFRELEAISTENFSTSQKGEAILRFTPPEPGTYQLDVFGEGARTEVMMWVRGSGSATWPRLTNQKINLVADKESYLPGDEAEIFIPNPFPEGAQALVTVERHKVISYQTLNINSSGESIKIPLSEDEAPNAYISVTLLGKNENGVVDFRQGYLNLLVEPVSRKMQVEIVGEPERLGPREEVEFTIRVTDQSGKPLQGEFTLAVVDKAVLALVDPNSPEIGEAFYGIQPISVRMGIPISMHAGRDVFIPGGMGGGGGDAFFVRSQFEDTGYWQADIVTDKNGMAKISFTVPDNLTTWQAETRGVTKDTQVGQASTEIVTSKDFLIRPVTPRFLVAGDHLALAAIVHNNTGKDQTADVTLQTTGIQLDIPDHQTQTIDIPDGGRTKVEWWGTVEDIQEVELVFSASAGEYRDAVNPYLGPLPVRRYTAPQSFGTSGVVEDPGQKMEIVTLPKTFDPGEGSLDIELSPSLAAALLKALDAMENDDYYSTIAIQSRFLPNVITYHTLQEHGLDYPQLESRLEIIIPDTLDILAAAQNDDGGWGWWEGSASDVEISSFILFGLSQAEKAGVFVDDVMMQNAKGYLLATLPSLDMLTEPWQYNLLAVRYFALSEAQIDVSGGMIELASLSSQLSPYAQALLAAGLESQIPGNSHSKTLYSNLVGSGIRTSTGIHWENPEECRCWLNNTTTTTAIVSYALARGEAFGGTMPEATRYLISTARPRGDWRSAYETGWAVLALNEILMSAGDLSASYDFSSELNGTAVITGTASGGTMLEGINTSIPVSTLYPADPNALVINRGEGEGTLYYKAHLNLLRPAEDVQPFGKGMSISRVYGKFREDDEPLFTQEGKVGDLIQVQLTLVLEHDAHYITVEDWIPAGTEILDTRLKTSQQDEAEFQVSSPFKNGWGWWYFNSPKVFDDRIVWTTSYLPAGTYQLIYTISLTHPGEYQVLPAHGWHVYFPETQAISAGEIFAIHPK